MPFSLSRLPMAEINSVSESPVPQAQAEMKLPKKTATPIPVSDTHTIKMNCSKG